jgi:predicted nucleic acid-binding protein
MYSRPKYIVINTGPLLALIAAFNSLDLLRKCFDHIIVPLEVSDEILNGKKDFGKAVFQNVRFLEIQKSYCNTGSLLWNVLDKGEASVIQTALDRKVNLVCIDEAVGRRYARLNKLALTGSCGIILFAKKNNLISNISDPLKKMKDHGIWLSKTLLENMRTFSGDDIV